MCRTLWLICKKGWGCKFFFAGYRQCPWWQAINTPTILSGKAAGISAKSSNSPAALCCPLFIDSTICLCYIGIRRFDSLSHQGQVAAGLESGIRIFIRCKLFIRSVIVALTDNNLHLFFVKKFNFEFLTYRKMLYPIKKDICFTSFFTFFALVRSASPRGCCVSVAARFCSVHLCGALQSPPFQEDCSTASAPCTCAECFYHKFTIYSRL